MGILEKQEECSQELQHTIRNYKKCPRDRKTFSYLEQQLLKVNQLWAQFSQIHNQICSDSSIPQDQTYYTTDLYGTLGEQHLITVNKLKEEIKEAKIRAPSVITSHPSGSSVGMHQEAITVPAPTTSLIEPTASAPTGSEPATSNLFLKQQRGICAVKDMLSQMMADPEPRSAEYCRMKLKTVEHHWVAIQQLHDHLWTHSDEYDLDEFLQHETEINDYMLTYSDRIKSLTSNMSSAATVDQHQRPRSDVKLPTIELPRFEGNYLKWRQYRDLFVEMVHNQALSGCHKLWYLKASLGGEAARLIQHITTTSDNYDSAWEIISSRYENKRLLIGALLQRLTSQQPTQRESSMSIKTLHDTTQECLLGLKALGVRVMDWDPLVLHLMTQQLDKQNQLLWEQSIENPRELPTLLQFMKFLEFRFQSMEAVGSSRKFSSPSNTLVTTIENCIACKQGHNIYQCAKFKNMTCKQRLQLIQATKCCVNCLKSGHTTQQCSSTRNCQRCNKRHNTLLHLDNPSSRPEFALKTAKPTPNSRELSTPQNIPDTPSSLVAAHSKSKATVLLSTVLLKVEGAHGQEFECRAVLDNGSQVNLMTQAFSKKLGIHGINHQLNIQGVGETQRLISKRASIQVSSRITAFNARIETLILPKIVSQQPRQYIEQQKWNIPKNIPLADPLFNVPNEIDLLIGAGLFYPILSRGQIKLGEGMPILQNTLFGWIVGGELFTDDDTEVVTCGMCTEDELFDSIEKFWEIEECPASSHQMTTAELKCEQHFKDTHRKAADGRFVVKLPFKEDAKALGSSYELALQRLKGVKKRLNRHDSLKHEYIKFMKEYEALGHMEEISLRDIQGPHYFLPHHAVLKPDSTTTKVRVVFDASAPTSSKMSLNEILSTGPTIQDDVFTQLLRFRFPRFVFTADIEKMYRQVWVHGDDRRFQLILWREDPTTAIKVFQLKTITYGTSSAPYLAVRCLRQLAEDNERQYPLASSVLQKNFYVDDVLAGSDDISTAVDQILQLRELLRSAGFNLRKWCANDQRLLKHIPEADREISLELMHSGRQSVKTMGLIWTPREDSFSLRAEPVKCVRVTKRSALADISRIFDPLGFMGPVTITAKIFLQKLWTLKLDWDAALPQELDSEWVHFHNEFEQLNNIRVPRHVLGHEITRQVQIHIFADASEKAYGAVAYVRSITKEKLVIVRFLCAKSKVAPAKQTTLPRLELCAAKLATDLMHRILLDLGLNKSCFHLWSDSTAVLGWINAQSSNYHTFVANRIASIQRVSTNAQWHHVPSQDNPADLISRGLRPGQLVTNSFWFYGPKFLHSEGDTWTNQALPIDECHLERRERAKITVMTLTEDASILNTIRHNNSFRRLQRVTAYLFRCTKPRTPGFQLLGRANLIIRPAELEFALHCIVKHIQQLEFHEHIKDIKRHKAVQHNSSLAHLTPFLDDKGILRVGGRLEAATLNYDAKHPMLLSHKHPFTKLLLMDLHKEHMHAGVQTLLAISRQQFWIVNGKTLARSVVHHCVQCSRARPKLAEQIMGSLPKDRVTPNRPFFITGVDFFGPIYVHFKVRGKRPQKAYVSVFCCFSTKAIHLEIVSDLTTEAFIGALKRFIGRRGRCQRIYCDNATNFAGTNNHLRELSHMIHDEEAQTKLLSTCSKNNIEFCFIPPRAPHFGGLWEAAVKSAKGLLQTTLSAASLTYEEMETVLVEAEAILNSRPLTAMSSDPNDLTALTPGHFLIGEPLTAAADSTQTHTKLSCLSRWNLVRHLKNEFWRRWSLEYLTGLQHRYKWNKEIQNINCGTMVIIKEDNLPPLKWTLGRIERVIPGADGRVRVADVRTTTGVSRRPIHKLAPLPIQEEPDRTNSYSGEDGRPLPIEKVTKPTTRPINSSGSRKRRSSANIATLLLTCLILPLVTSASVTTSPFENDPGIYFERIGMANIMTSSWNLINFFDLRPLWKEAEVAQQYMTVLSQICASFENQKTCQTTIKQVQQQTRLIEDNTLLLRQPHRAKRGAFNLIGNVSNSLFGLLDSEYAEELSRTIENLKGNDDVLKRHIENQTIFLDRTLSIMKRDRQDTEKELNVIKVLAYKTSNELARLSKQVVEQQLSSAFNEVALQAFMQLSRLRAIQDAIVDIVTDAHHGKLSPELLSPRELQEELRMIDEKTAKTMKLPFAITNITQYYRLMSVSHQITESYVIFNVHIPLTTSLQFELLRLTAVPWHKTNKFYKLNLATAYLLVDLLREHYYTLSYEELQQCISLDSALFFCPQSQPLSNQNSQNSQCEFSILKESTVTSSCHIETIGSGPYWLPLHDPNAWIYVVAHSELLNVVCNNNPSQLEISRSGILRIEDNCVVKTKQATIAAHVVITKTRQVNYIPTCNISRVQFSDVHSEHIHATTINRSLNDINNLQEELKEFKTVSLNTLRPHDIHHYGLGYTIFALVICLIVGILYYYVKQRGTPSFRTPQPVPRRLPPTESTVADAESGTITIF